MKTVVTMKTTTTKFKEDEEIDYGKHGLSEDGGEDSPFLEFELSAK
jgi:hypothetical protein